jgi:hypothetical protein
MSEINEEKEKKKPVSKLGAMLSNSQEVNNSQVCVYYSQNNWKTSEVVEVMIEEKTTVLQLIDMVIFKLKTEFYYDNIDEKNCILMLLKKKTKTPNYDYPKCNPESVVLNYNKSNFCLVEVNSTKSDNTNESEKKNNDEAKDAIMGNVGNENQNKKEEKKEELKNEIKKEDNKEQNNKSNKSNKNKKKTAVKTCDKGCNIF